MTLGAKILNINQMRVKKNNRCIFCNGSENPQLFRRQIVCADCLKSIRSLYSNGYFGEEKGAN